MTASEGASEIVVYNNGIVLHMRCDMIEKQWFNYSRPQA